MSEGINGDGKLQGLIEKFGGWAAGALIMLLGYMYQGDRANTQAQYTALEKSVAANSRAINRLNDGKVSKEELKQVQQQWIRETQGLREDIRDMMRSLQSSPK